MFFCFHSLDDAVSTSVTIMPLNRTALSRSIYYSRICASPVPFENRLFTVNTFPTWTVALYTGIWLHVKQVIVIWYCCFIGLIHSWVFNKDLQILFRIGEHNNRTASAQNGPTWTDSSVQQERKWPVHPYWKWSKECMERFRPKPKTNRWMLWTVRKIWNMINSHTIATSWYLLIQQHWNHNERREIWTDQIDFKAYVWWICIYACKIIKNKKKNKKFIKLLL